MLDICPATTRDIPLLRDLAQRIWHEHYPGIISREQIDYMLARMYDPGVIQSELVNGVFWCLARLDNAPAGFFAYEFNRTQRSIKLHKLYLLPAFHGQGLGRQMLEYVLSQARALNALEILLQVNKNNTRALRAYQCAGFQIRQSLIADIGAGFVMDDFIMYLPLA